MKWVTFLKEDPNGLYQPGETRYLNDDAAKKYLDKNIAVIHGWKCLRCGEGPIEQEKKPKICPNPNCQSKTFKAFHPIEHDEVAQAIYQNIPIVAAEDNGELWIYQNEGENKGVYSNDIAESVIKEKIKDLKPGCKQHFRNEVLDYIRIENYISRKKLGLSERKIAVKNGILDLESRELEEFGPEKYVISKIPVKYDPDAECPEIKKFIESLVGNGKDVNKIVEMIGYSLLRENPLNKAFMGLGPGENGRSTLFNLIQEFLGIKNVAGVDLTDLIYDRFASADLYGKLANMCADISDRKIKHSGRFKKQVGEDLIRAQHKNQDAFHFKNYATPWFSANELPETTDKTRSFYRRWVIINFPYTFTSDPEELEKEGYKEKNSDLPDSIITDKELSGLLNWALNCLENVLGNKRFTNERTIEEKRELWELESDPVLEFIDTWCIEDKKKGEEYLKTLSVKLTGNFA
ncbi:MAG: phage/plasmid primase, P4 family [Candidatus Hadarchaeia archaeon]